MRTPKNSGPSEQPQHAAEPISYFTNLRIYRSIAEEALAESQRLSKSARRPKPDGPPGSIIWDLERRSFKQALVAIVFARVYLDALLYIVGSARLGKRAWTKLEKGSWKARLDALGLKDENLLRQCLEVAAARNEIVHEKAERVDDEHAMANAKFAQKEADKALCFVAAVRAALDVDGD